MPIANQLDLLASIKRDVGDNGVLSLALTFPLRSHRRKNGTFRLTANCPQKSSALPFLDEDLLLQQLAAIQALWKSRDYGLAVFLESYAIVLVPDIRPRDPFPTESQPPFDLSHRSSLNLESIGQDYQARKVVADFPFYLALEREDLFHEMIAVSSYDDPPSFPCHPNDGLILCVFG
jgi:hypothetical protein